MSAGPNVSLGLMIVEVSIVVRELDGKPGSGPMMAVCNAKGRASEVALPVVARTRSSCGHFTAKQRKLGCEVEVSVFYPRVKKQPLEREFTRITSLAEPDLVASAAGDLAKELVFNLQHRSQNQEGVKEVVGDIITTSTTFISEAYNILPIIHGAVNGDPQAAVVGVVNAMSKDPEGQGIMKNLGAAVSGDQDKMAELKEQMKDFPMSGMIFDFLDQARNQGKK